MVGQEKFVNGADKRDICARLNQPCFHRESARNRNALILSYHALSWQNYFLND